METNLEAKVLEVQDINFLESLAKRIRSGETTEAGEIEKVLEIIKENF